MKQYLSLIHDVMINGNKREDRTGTGTISSFGHRLEFDLRDGFPLVTTKFVPYRLIATELLWMISGETSAQYLIDNNNHIWDEWMLPGNELGRVYGVQWRRWRSTSDLASISVNKNNVDIEFKWVDQLQNAINSIRTNPTDRRMLVSAWNPGELDEMALPPCHLLYQFYVDGEYLDCQVYQRSADVFLGLPFDIASYATLMHMVGYVTGKKPRKLIYVTGDTHIYTNHVEQCLTMLRREPKILPRLVINPTNREINEIDDFLLRDLSLVGYESHGRLTGEVSI